MCIDLSINSWAFSLVLSWINWTPAIQPHLILILQPNTILSFTVSCFSNHYIRKSSQVKENRFTLTLSQYFRGHRVCRILLPTSSLAIMQSLLLLVDLILPELPWTDELMLVSSYIPLSLLVIWHEAIESSIYVYFVHVKNNSWSAVHIIPI